MKKLLLAAVAILTVGAASSSFAGGCGTSYEPVYQHHYQTQHQYVQPCHKEVITVPVYQPCHKRVIIQQPCHTTYVKPVVHTYHTPVYYHYRPGYNHHYTSSCGGY